MFVHEIHATAPSILRKDVQRHTKTYIAANVSRKAQSLKAVRLSCRRRNTSVAESNQARPLDYEGLNIPLQGHLHCLYAIEEVTPHTTNLTFT